MKSAAIAVASAFLTDEGLPFAEAFSPATMYALRASLQTIR